MPRRVEVESIRPARLAGSLAALLFVSFGLPGARAQALTTLSGKNESQKTTQFAELSRIAPAPGVVLQAFDWPFDLVTERLPELAAIGYTHIHVSPPSLSIDRVEWWARYQPIDYRVIDGPLGDEESFSRMNDQAESLGIKIIADVVLNHMANPDFARFNERYTENPESLYYPPPDARRKYGLPILFEPADFNPTGCIQDYDNRQQVVFDRLCLGFPDKGLPDLDLGEPKVIEAQKNFLRRLSDLGVDGFRVDALKHMPPESINVLFEGYDFDETLIFGEIIARPDNFRREIDPYANSSEISFYDFPRLVLMRDAFRPEGSLRSLVRPEDRNLALGGSRAITFVVNHDIPNNGDIFRWLEFYDKSEEHMAYTYVLGQESGLAYVYSDLGRAGGLVSDRYLNAYRDPVIVKQIGFRSLVEGTNQTFLWESDQVLAWMRSDYALVVVNKSGSESFDLSKLNLNKLQDGQYTEALSASGFNLSEGVLLEEGVSVPPRGSALFVNTRYLQ